jgi:DNA-directed RNA polymerase specialized sigma24 family protein
MKHCEHKFLIPPDFSVRQSAADCVAFGKVSPFCIDCWQRQCKEVPEEYRAEIGKPWALGFCDLIASVARKRGYARDSSSREDIEGDLRLHLMEKQAAIERGIKQDADEQGIDPKNPDLIRNHVLRALKNFLTDKQGKSSAGKVIRNTVKSLSPEGLVITSRKQAARERAGDLLTDLTGGDSSSTQDDYTLDEKDALFTEGPDSGLKSGGKRSEARVLFDTMLHDASSQIATLTGGRKDGFDVRLDLKKALTRLPDDERSVFEWLWLENGQLLTRARSYADVQRELNLSLQGVRTLEMKAVQKLKPALGPSFYKHRLRQ